MSDWAFSTLSYTSFNVGSGDPSDFRFCEFGDDV